MKLHKLLLTAMAGSFFLASCSSDDNGDVASGAYDNGVLILNEGGFMAGNASVSFLSNDFVLENNIFSNVNNGDLLGDTAQDMGFRGDLAYIVLNFSNKIEVVNRYTFEKVATIEEGLINPRYIAFHDGKAYVTNWGDGNSPSDDFVAVISLDSNTVASTIPVGEGPENIIEADGKLYVAHKGGYGYGNTISVISGNNVSAVIEVGDVPGSIEEENGKLYVMCEGKPSWASEETAGQLNVISLSTNQVIDTYEFTEGHPGNLVIEGNKIFYTVDSDIYSMGINADALPQAPLFSTTEQDVYGVYSFEVEGGHIFVGDAGDYTSNGKVHVYTMDGALYESYTVGVIPAGFYFND